MSLVETLTSPPSFFSSDVSEARRFYLDLNPSKKKKLVVVCGGVEFCNADYSIQRASFPFFSIEYVVRGMGKLVLGGQSSSLQAGRLFSYGPGVIQEISGDANAPLVKYFVDFAGTEALKFLHSCRLSPGSVSDVFPTVVLQPLFEEIIQAGGKMGPESAELCAKLLECLILKISGARSPLGVRDSHAFTNYQRALQHIETHCLRLRTLADISRECHLTDAYLCRLFQRFDNQTPYQYLRRLKMNHAAERLQQPNAIVRQVAEEAGFPDPFHFSRVFTAVFGLSPTAWRKLRANEYPLRQRKKLTV